MPPGWYPDRLVTGLKITPSDARVEHLGLDLLGDLLRAAEHRLLPEVVRDHVGGDVVVDESDDK